MGADCLVNGVPQICYFEKIFANIVGAVGALAGIVFLIMLITGGFRYMTSGGNPKGAEAAKGTITAAFIGVILVVASFIILRLLSVFTGFDLTTFQIVHF
jgi:hypothetical protein